MTNVPRIIIMVGLPGSGKSTHARKLMDGNPRLLRVNRDSLRAMALRKGEWNPNVEKLILSVAEQFVRLATLKGYDVVIDDTNITRKQRAVWTHIACQLCIPVHIIHMTETERNLELRMKDPRGESEQKWRMVIGGMRKRFEDFSDDELAQTESIERVAI